MSDKPQKPIDRLEGKIRASYKNGVESESATSVIKIVTSHEQSKHGSVKPKIDLDDLIQDFKFDNNNPPWNNNTKASLINYLENLKSHGIIDDIEDGIIHWTDSKGRAKESAVTGLKDRYYK